MKRHDLVLLNYNYFKKNNFIVSNNKNNKIILDWIYNEYPFIISINNSNKSENLNIGFMLPLEKDKKKISFTVNKGSVYKYINPVKLSKILLSIERRWNSPLRELVDSFLTIKIDLFVFGSSMWQYILKKEYMTSNSDIDLLWKPITRRQLDSGLIILEKWMNKYNLKIDGEIEFPCQSACSWKELLNNDKKIIIKRLKKVSLESKYDLINTLEGV